MKVSLDRGSGSRGEGAAGPPRRGLALARGLPLCLFLAGSLLLGACVQNSQTAGSGAQEVRVLAKQFEYVPAEIRVKAGVLVKLVVTNVDVDHGLAFVDERAPSTQISRSGRTTTMTFLPDTRGTFLFKCSTICGPRHEDMVGKLVVE